MPEPVSVLGLGLMGRPLARVLAESGYDVSGWNRSPLAGELVAGIRVVDLDEAAAAETLLLFLFDTDAVAEVLCSLEPHLRRGQLVVDLGTSRPSDSVERAARLAELGVGWVDAPVSGGPEAIAERRLAVMAGGSEPDVARARPILEEAGTVVRVGGPGAGHAVKLINQVIVCLTIEAVAEALVLAETCGLELELVREALTGGSADSRVLQVQGSRMIARDYSPAAKATIMVKDLRLIAELAGAVGARLPHVDSTLALYEQLVAAGDGGLDVSALHKLRLAAGPQAPGSARSAPG
jgi:3-hydroxyisobutyrate dehydrogenase-like beta-hydroxyacid dehydrogenase